MSLFFFGIVLLTHHAAVIVIHGDGFSHGVFNFYPLLPNLMEK